MADLRSFSVLYVLRSGQISAMVKSMNVTAALPTPRSRVLHESARAYDFGNGATGRIDHRPSGRFDWVVEVPGENVLCGSSTRGDTAFLRMWCRAASLSKPDPIGSWAEIDARAQEAETAVVTNVAKVYRRLLKLRTGFAWSVRVGKTTARNTIRIMSTTRRLAAGKMTAHDAALLASIVGVDFVNPRSGITVSGDKGKRRAMTYLLAGVPQPCAPLLRLAR